MIPPLLCPIHCCRDREAMCPPAKRYPRVFKSRRQLQHSRGGPSRRNVRFVREGSVKLTAALSSGCRLAAMAPRLGRGYRECESHHLDIQTVHKSITDCFSKLEVTQFGQRSRFGAEKPQVQILPSRSKGGLCRPDQPGRGDRNKTSWCVPA